MAVLLGVTFRRNAAYFLCVKVLLCRWKTVRSSERQ